MSLSGIVAGLGAVQPVKGRTVAQLASNGMRVIDDTYNANPDSMRAAVDVLAGFSGRTVLVLGDIGELGDGRSRGTARWANTPAARFPRCYAVGPMMAHAVNAFGEQARHFGTQAELIKALDAEQDTNTTILVKGSRSLRWKTSSPRLCGTSLEKH